MPFKILAFWQIRMPKLRALQYVQVSGRHFSFSLPIEDKGTKRELPRPRMKLSHIIFCEKEPSNTFFACHVIKRNWV